MNSLETNETVNLSAEALIDWSTSEIIMNTTHDGNYYNNPFDVMELKATNMDPFDLVSNQISLSGDNNMLCNNILTTSWKLEFGQIRKSMSLTDINSVTTDLKLNGQNHTGSVELINYNAEEINNQSNINCVPENIDDNKELKNDLILTSTSEYYNTYIEKMALCNEEEKRQIREQTQQRIKMLIEKEEKNYEENYIDKSLVDMLQHHTESCLNNTENVFNKGFIKCSSIDNLDTFSKTPNSKININDDTLINVGLVYSNQEQNYFDLNALKPEWVMDNFSDTDGSVEIQTEKSEPVAEPNNSTNQFDENLKALNRIGMIESKLNGYRTVLKSTQNKKTLNNGPFLANIPVHHMMQNYNEIKIKNMNQASISSQDQIKPIASSTPTLKIDSKFQTPSPVKCSLTACLSQQSAVNSIESPKTPLNITKCIKQNSVNSYVKDNTIAPTKVTHLFGSINKRSNSTINMFNETVQKKTEIKSFQMNKSKSESIIRKIPKPLALKTNKISNLPVPKRSTILYKGKENIKLE